jgi:hypothetical protein
MKIVTLPIYGLWFVFEKIAQEVERAQGDETESLRRDLVRAYEEWQSGAIGEAEFSARERRLARRLARCQRRAARDGH